MLSIRTTLPLAMLLLSGCVVGPDHSAPVAQLPAKFAEGSQTSNGNIASVAWWTAFNDSRLNSYVNTGLAQNLDLLQTLEAINQADAAVTVETAGSLPSLTGQAAQRTSGANGSFANNTDVVNAQSGALNVSWLLDLFGQYRRAREGALANVDAAYARADVQRLTLVSAVAAAYVDVRFFQARLSIARQNLASRRETLDLTKLQLEAGAASRLDVVKSEGLVNNTLAEMPELETQFRRAAHRLATLLGLPAASLVSELQKGAPQPVARSIAKSGIPADLIRNRPDIRAAERVLAAEVAKIGVAEAALYPAITLGGAITPTFTNINSGPNGSNTTWNFGPSLVLPIFDGGRIKANINIADSRARAAYLAWQATVLKAVEEVENGLTAVNRDKRTEDARRKALASAREALNLATSSYRDGASSLLDVLDAQREVSSAQAAVAQAVQKTAQDYIALSTALGGGYATGVTPTPPAAAALVTRTN
jgi:multidrug efflux system outer membrane protein